MLGVGLRAADIVARLLPRDVAYGLADLIGRAWYRLAAERRALMDELKVGGMAVLVADRNLAGKGHPTTLFGATASLPTGPATLALISGRPLLVAACRRLGPERFNVRAWHIEAELSGDRRADVATLTEAIARRMEEAISLAPEQWFAAFQAIWDSSDG